jgi:hypothetical protein
MPDLIAQLMDAVDIRHGVLVAVANRHQVALHVINDQTIPPSINHLGRLAQLGFSDSSGAQSP